MTPTCRVRHSGKIFAAFGVYLFAQDSWKIKPSLTLNYGLPLGVGYALG